MDAAPKGLRPWIDQRRPLVDGLRVFSQPHHRNLNHPVANRMETRRLDVDGGPSWRDGLVLHQLTLATARSCSRSSDTGSYAYPRWRLITKPVSHQPMRTYQTARTSRLGPALSST